MNERPIRSYDLIWLSLTLLVLVALSFLFPIRPQDYWWCLRVGRDIVSAGAVPVTENLSWSQAGQPILYEPWLACVVFERVHVLGGASGIFFLRGLLIGLTYGLLWVLAGRELGPQLAAALVLTAGLAGSNNWEMRAQLFAYPLFVLCLYILLEWQSGSDKLLWLLPAITVLWANLHGSFILSLVLTGFALLFGKGNRKALFIVILLMLAGTLITPHGIALWTHLYFMLTVPANQQFSLEWRAPVNEGWQMNVFFAWVLSFAPLAAFSSRKLSVMEWGWFLAFGWLAFSGVRYVIWFLLLIVPLTGKVLTGVLPRRQNLPSKNRHAAFNIALALLFVLLSLLYLPGIRETWWAQAPSAYDSEITPIKAVEWLSRHPDLPGPMWNDYAFGSYLAYALPSRPVWVDSRFFPFTAAQMDEYLQISRGSPLWESVFEREKINLLVLSTTNQSALIKLVESSEQWCEQYRDETAVIFSRCEPMP
ncbi:MAG: hypothetical protein Kow0070_00150 [Anaerolineales bacterium]